MNRHVFLVGLVWSALGCVAAAPALPGRPNVLFIVVDDLRPELGCYGVKQMQTPNIDRLARSGVTFDRAYCQQALCAPSRASALSGARPDTIRVHDLYTNFREALPADAPTLPELFKRNGYFAEGLGKIFHIEDPASWSTVHEPQGFGAAAAAGPRPVYGNPTLNQALQIMYEQGRQAGLVGVQLQRAARGPVYEMVAGEGETLLDRRLADQAIALLQARSAQPEPFFLALGFYKPHLPFVVPRKFWDLYDRAALELPAKRDAADGAPPYASDSSEIKGYVGVPELPVGDDYARFLRHGYYASVSFIDAQIGRVLSELDRLGLDRNTIVVFWGDHGFKLGDLGGWGKGGNTEWDTRVPLIVRVPGNPGNGQRASGMVELVDLYPTLAELAGLAPPSHLEGQSFLPILRRPGLAGKPAAFSQHPRAVKGRKLMGYTMRTPRYRFTRWMDLSGEPKADAAELYDHAADPGETVNVAQRPDYADAMKALEIQFEAGWRGTPARADARGKE